MSDMERLSTLRRRWQVFLVAALLCSVLIAPNASPATASDAGDALAATPGAIASPSPTQALIDRTTTAIDFPIGLHVTGELVLPEGTTALSFVYRGGYDEGWNLVDVPDSDIVRGADGAASIDTTFDFQALQVPLGVHLTYRWIATTPEGQATSAPAATDWYDNRQPWQELTSDQVTLRYYGMDQSFGQSILDSAQGTIADLEQRYDLARSERLTIWVYPDAATFREGLPANFRESVVGGSVVGYPLIVAVIPPGSESEVGRVIPHEISHQVLFQATRNPFGLLPTWFDEGMATHTQIGGTGGFMGMVIAAERKDALLDLASLTGSFPYTPSQASLAYAESWSAIAFIEDRWGEEGIAALIRAFANGLPEDQAVPQALGIPMTTFTADWRAWIVIQA